MTLPETDLDLLDVFDHEGHHVALHDSVNKLMVDASVGDVLTKLTSGTGPTSIGPRQPQFVAANQVVGVSHAASGDLVVPLDRFTRAVKVTASDNITGLATDPGQFALLGAQHAAFKLLIIGVGTIDLDLTPTDADVIVVGDVPASLTDEPALFRIERWT